MHYKSQSPLIYYANNVGYQLEELTDDNWDWDWDRDRDGDGLGMGTG